MNLKRLTGTLLLFLIGLNAVFAQKPELRFNRDKTFKIAQFTDIHWSNTSENCAETIETIRFVLETEKPDLAVLTGDIVTDVPAKEGWLAVTLPFVEAGVPLAVVLGNHDAEPGITREEIFDVLETLPNFVGEKGPELTGCGNYTVPIGASAGDKTQAILYCFDSNSYSVNKKISDYDWVHLDQINWYQNTSREVTSANNGAPLPALAFLHIPLPEYSEVVGDLSTVGLQKEKAASAKVNSGLFTSMLEMRDVMGVYVGHNHKNNYIGINKDIALAFGQVTGADAYGDFERGSRIIELKEGEFSFDTWIRTKEGVSFKYNYPAGFPYDDSAETYSPATEEKDLSPGVAYKYYEGEFESVAEFASARPVDEGYLKNFSLEKARKDDYFAFEFDAYLQIGKRGVYGFYSYSDDGSQLYIDGQLVVKNDGSHSAKRVDGRIALEAGFHKIKLLYFESYMGQELEVGISGISIRETQIPNNMLFIKE